jgi:hypothetical protein
VPIELVVSAKYGDLKVFDRLIKTDNSYFPGAHVISGYWNWGRQGGSPAQYEPPLRDAFNSKSTDTLSDADKKAAIDGVTADVTKKLVELRKSSYQQLVLSVQASGAVQTTAPVAGLRKEMVELEGARRLIELVATLAFPEAMRTDDGLRMLLEGGPQGERLVGEREIVGMYTKALDGDEKTLTADVTGAVKDAVHDRSKALQDRIDWLLDLISMGVWVESCQIVETPIAKLNALIAQRKGT